MTRILMTTDAVGGVWSYSLDLAGGLSRLGVDTVLAVLGPALTPDQRQAAETVAGLRIIDTGLPLDWMVEDARAQRRAAQALADLANRLQVELVHLNNPAFAADGDFAAPVVGVCHSCLATWWSAVKSGPMPVDFEWRTEILVKGLVRCNALVAPSAAFAEAVRQAYGLRPEVVWNGRRPEPLPAVADPEPVAVTAGRLWDEGKDLATLDAAAGWLEFPVVAMGPTRGPQGQTLALHNLATPGALSHAEVCARFARAPVFVSTAVYEPFGLAVLEAAQAGCALVLTDIPTFRELWEGAAVFVPPRDPVGVTLAVRRLMRDPAERQALAAAARRRSQVYCLEAMRAGVVSAYRAASPKFEALTKAEAAA